MDAVAASGSDSNQAAFNLVTPSGIVTACRDLQDEKTLAPTEDRLSGRVTLESM